MSTIGSRLKDERVRLGLSQVELANIMVVSRRTVIDWEQGKTSPTVLQISPLSNHNVDLLYILTSQRILTESVLSPREHAFLDNYRHLSEEDKNSLEKVSAALVQLNNSSD